MRINGAKIAAAISLMYFLHTLSVTIEAAFAGIPFSVIWFTLTQPRPLSTTIVCLLLSVGLWRQYRWAWWLGAVAVAIQFGRIVEFWIAAPSIASENILSQVMVLSFIIVIVMPSTRRLCVRGTRT